MKNYKNSQKLAKNAQNARSGPWWDRTRPKLGLETTTIVFSIPIGFRNRINLLLILKSRFCWTQLPYILPYTTMKCHAALLKIAELAKLGQYATAAMKKSFDFIAS